LAGWRSKRKIVVFESDDWGSVRNKDLVSRNQLEVKGIDTESSSFNRYDSFESTEDLHKLYEVLTSVKDKNNRNAVFAPLVIVANPDFEKIFENNFQNIYMNPCHKQLGHTRVAISSCMLITKE
jgi:hypothetical protein